MESPIFVSARIPRTLFQSQPSLPPARSSLWQFFMFRNPRRRSTAKLLTSKPIPCRNQTVGRWESLAQGCVMLFKFIRLLYWKSVRISASLSMLLLSSLLSHFLLIFRHVFLFSFHSFLRNVFFIICYAKSTWDETQFLQFNLHGNENLIEFPILLGALRYSRNMCLGAEGSCCGLFMHLTPADLQI